MALSQFVTRTLPPRTHYYLTAAVPKILCVRMALGTIAQNRNFLGLQKLLISVGVVKNFGSHNFLFSCLLV